MYWLARAVFGFVFSCSGGRPWDTRSLIQDGAREQVYDEAQAVLAHSDLRTLLTIRMASSTSLSGRFGSGRASLHRLRPDGAAGVRLGRKIIRHRGSEEHTSELHHLG